MLRRHFLRVPVAGLLLQPWGTGSGSPSGITGLSLTSQGVGAIGDGVTDDTAALQAAINANPSNKVLSGEGKTYKITAPLLIPDGSTHLMLTDLNLAVSGDVASLKGPSSEGLVRFFRLERCLITCKEHVQVGRPAVDFQCFSMSTFRDVWILGTAGITDCFYGIVNKHGSAPYYDLFENIYAGGFRYAFNCNDSGSDATGVNSITIADSRAQPSTAAAVRISRYCENIRIRGLSVEGRPEATGIDCDGIGCEFDGCRFELLGTGIKFGAHSYANTSLGHYWSSCKNNVAYAEGAQDRNSSLGDSTATAGSLFNFGGRLRAVGGYRQTIGPWHASGISPRQAQFELTRADGRWIATRSGSVTGIIVKSSLPRAAGACVVRIYRNSGLAGAKGGLLGSLTASLDDTAPNQQVKLQSPGKDPFTAGDELFICATTDAGWAPDTASIQVMLEVET